MLQALRAQAAVIPQLPLRSLLSQDLIDPLAVFALQLYLAF